MLNKLKYIFIRGSLKRHIKNSQKPMPRIMAKVSSLVKEDSLNILNQQEKPFSITLLNLIDKKGITDVECYKRANIDRKLFSKIRSNIDYKPSKNTVLALVIALKLDLQEANTLLCSAGYSLSNSFIADIIITYFIQKRNYDIDLINIALDDYNEKPLGSF